MKKIKTVIFDMGGVLVDLDQQACLDAFARIGCSEIAQLLDPYLQTGPFLAIEEGKITDKELYDAIRQSAGRADIPDEAIRKAFCAFLIDIPAYKLDLIKSLRDRGYQTYLLSNTNPIIMDEMKRTAFTAAGLTIDDYFDRLFLSYEMGVAKPSPRIFEMMIEQSGMVPSESLFIDDAPANIAVAEQFGIQAYLAGPQEDFRHLFTDF